MQKRYVVVADPDQLTLDQDWLAPYQPKDLQWLSPGKACEFVTDQTLILPDDTPLDCFEFGSQETNRKKKILFCDMDATAIENESLDELTRTLPQDIQDKISDMTLQTMYGKVDLDASIRKRISYLKGLNTNNVQQAHTYIRPTKGIRTVIRTMKQNDGYAVLISSGFTCISEYVRDTLDFDEDHANQLSEENNHFTGEVTGRMIDGEAKGHITRETLKRLGLNAHHALAIGDGSNDVYMLKETDMGIAYHGKPILKETAHHQINHTSLISALYAQGYTDQEIIF